MGNSTSRVVGCFAPLGNEKDAVDLEFLEPLDEGLGHSFCYVRPAILDSPAITPSNSERFMVDSSVFDSEANGVSFRQEIAEECAGLQRPTKFFSETTFKTISGASVSANASTARTGNPNLLVQCDAQEPAASFESTASFAAIPLQPVPRGSGPLNGFMSGPLERGFTSGPLEKGGGFMSGPLERGIFMSGPLDNADRSNFSAPLAYSKRRVGLGHLVRSVSGPMRSAFSQTFMKHLPDRNWMQRFFQPMTQFMRNSKDAKNHHDVPQNCVDVGPSEIDYNESRNLQWAHGKAGEDRVHVVLSEEQGWLFVGIYDGFSGPDAPDFLMSNLYRSIDKELEGLLWDYDDKDAKEVTVSTCPETVVTGESKDSAREDFPTHQSLCDDVERKCSDHSVLHSENGSRADTESSNVSAVTKEIVDIARKDKGMNNLQITGNIRDDCTEESCQRNVCTVAPTGVPENDGSLASLSKISGQGKKSMRLYQLLQMELMEEYAMDGSLSASEIRSGRMDFFSMQSGDLCSRNSIPAAQLDSCSGKDQEEGSCYSGLDGFKQQNDEAVSEEFSTSKQKTKDAFFVSGHGQRMKRLLIGAKLRKMYRRQKSLRKKLFPWSYDWHRETHADEILTDSSVSIRRCKSGSVDHDAVLQAMTRALQTTEEAYMKMVESTLDRNPELALMGSCVLVMLMKDQDVYVMNLGDSRVILAQERTNDRHGNLNLAKDDLRIHNRSRESIARVELDRISEESPMHNQNNKVNNINKNQEISIHRLRVKALQLSTDHCTSIEEVCFDMWAEPKIQAGICRLHVMEVMRIKGEHKDDAQAVFKDRVKGQLKVTRAFGAAFLKKPKFNEALLEMFRIDYVGTSPYLSCIPSVLHHRLCSSDCFLVLSSDGLYQYFSNDEVVSHVAWFMENMPEGDPAQYLIAELLLRAAKKNGMDFHELLDIPQGDRRKYHDDVSVMVISLEGRIWRSSG